MPDGSASNLYSQSLTSAEIVPFDDSSDNILAWVASVGSKFDIMIGALNSSQMLKYCDYYELGTYDLCVAVPRNHRLAVKETLQSADLHGEHLMMVTPGDTKDLQNFYDMLRMTHPQILIKGDGYCLQSINRQAKN